MDSCAVNQSREIRRMTTLPSFPLVLVYLIEAGEQKG
jgi:hypothetical protein